MRPVEHKQNYPGAPRVVPNVNFFALCRAAPTKAAAVAAITEWAEGNRGVHLNSSGIYSRITRQGCCWNERGFYKEGEAEDEEDEDEEGDEMEVEEERER